MSAIVIAEKPQQARDIEAAVGSKYGKVLPAQGHLFRLEMPEENNPAYADRSSDALLLPQGGRYKFIPDRNMGRGPRIDAIKAALKTATMVVIATDCDREGQLIGGEILEAFGYRGPVKRAMFTAQDPVSLQKAFAKLEDNSKYANLYAAGVARQQADQIFNLTLTRVATNNLKKDWTDNRKPIGIGRVKTPTLAIVCRRELEIRLFKPLDFFTVSMTVKGAAGEATLHHRPDGDDRILDKTRAEAIAAAARAFSGPVSVVTTRKNDTPPRPLDLPAMQKAMAKYGWPAQKTLDTAQALYETYKITTYPRAESRYLPETMIPDAGPILADLKRMPDYGSYKLAQPEIRKGKKGLFSDAALEGTSHHAIIPNVNCPGGIAATVGKLPPDEAKLFDVIARFFLAAIGEDRTYDSTKISGSVTTPAPSPCEFAVTGQATVSPGYTAILGAAGDDQDEPAVTPLKNGEIVKATAAAVEAQQTKPPPRYTEGALIEAMQNAWKFIEDPIERDRLKEAKGIGTPATRGTVLEGLKAQNLITLASEQKSKVLVPTDAGLTLYQTLLAATPALVDPGLTARMEQQLDDVQLGKLSADAVISAIAKQAGDMIPVIQKAGKTVTVNNAKQAVSLKALKSTGAKSTGAKSKKPSLFGKPKSPAPQGSPTKTAAPTKSSFTPRPPAAAFDAKKGLQLKVPFERKDEAKALGARFDGDSRSWYAPPGVAIDPFRQKGFL